MEIERTALVGIQKRVNRGGTPDIQVLAKRGKGGAMLSIGGGRREMMTEADRALTEEARAAIVDGRQAPRIEEIILPAGVAALLDLGLLFDPKSNRIAMRGEVTIGQMRQFVQETRYRPAKSSHNAEEFDRLIREGDANAPMVFTNEADCLAFIRWALLKVQASDPRIQTLALPSDGEWVEMRQVFRGQQTGSNWERLSDGFFRSFPVEVRNSISDREFRFYYCAFRLVGTYKN